MRIVRHPAFRWILTFILLGLMGYQLWSRSDHFQTLGLISFSRVGWWIGLAFLLMPVNWLLEAFKWKTLLSVHYKTSFITILKGVTCGVALAIFTPGRIGEYGGRIMFMPAIARWPAAVSSFIGSIAQSMVALTAGVISCLLLFETVPLVKILTIAIVLFFGICFYQMKYVIRMISRLKTHSIFDKWVQHIDLIEDYSPGVLTASVGIALSRYLVYTFQFFLLLQAFEPAVHPGALLLGISAVYLFQTLVPLPPFADVLARTNIGLILWSGAGLSELSITLASLLVWLINLLIPAIAGSFIIGTTTAKNSLDTDDPFVPSAHRPAIVKQPTGN